MTYQIGGHVMNTREKREWVTEAFKELSAHNVAQLKKVDYDFEKAENMFTFVHKRSGVTICNLYKDPYGEVIDSPATYYPREDTVRVLGEFTKWRELNGNS
jgi:hypothetical protein